MTATSLVKTFALSATVLAGIVVSSPIVNADDAMSSQMKTDSTLVSNKVTSELHIFDYVGWTGMAKYVVGFPKADNLSNNYVTSETSKIVFDVDPAACAENDVAFFFIQKGDGSLQFNPNYESGTIEFDNLEGTFGNGNNPTIYVLYADGSQERVITPS